MIDSERTDSRRIPFVCVFAGCMFFAYGIAKVYFAGAMLLVTTVLGAKFGPTSLFVLNAADLLVGAISALTAANFLLGRQWAGRILRTGWAAVVLYEVGRALGMAAVGFDRFASSADALNGLGSLALLLLAGLGVQSRTSRTYFERK